MVEENFENHRSETHRNEGFQQLKDFTMVEENFGNHRSETHRNEGFQQSKDHSQISLRKNKTGKKI